MKRRLAAILAFATVTALTLGAPAFAHDAGPCAETAEPGHSEYAKHHVVVQAHEGTLGAGEHTPGAHRGFSACNPSGR